MRAAKVEIQNPRLENIARIALQTALENQRRLIVVEDSGLFIERLRGFPGPYSSFVYETIGLKGILSLLRGSRNRRAYFQSSVAVGSPSLEPQLFTGTVRGRISRSIFGETGFGYDPIFIPDGSKKTFGQTSWSFKNGHSHRAAAFQKFAKWFRRRQLMQSGLERVR